MVAGSFRRAEGRQHSGQTRLKSRRLGCLPATTAREKAVTSARKKRPPEKMGPRGAKDAIRFRERLDALSGRLAHAGMQAVLVKRHSRRRMWVRWASRCAKRTARIHAGGERSVVRRKSLRLFLMQTLPIGLQCLVGAANSPQRLICCTHEAGRICKSA